MKFYKKVFAAILAVTIIVSTPCISFASNSKDNITSVEYEEYHDQINFDNLMILVANKKDIIVDVDPAISLLKKFEAKKQKKKYDRYIENHPEAAKELMNAINSSDYICAISYTETPLVYVEDHYERIPKEDSIDTNPFGINASAADKTLSSNPSQRYRLTLKTTITRRGSSNPYTYYASTSGTWDNSASVFDGETQPDVGNDFIMQSCPTVTNSAIFSSTYNYSTNGSKNGQEGINYFMTDGGDSWVKYEVVDDPTGIAQLKIFSLQQTFKAQTTTTTKKINSYYIHTWEEMSISVSASGNAGTSGGKPSAGVTLSFTPTTVDKHWQLYNFVSYNW